MLLRYYPIGTTSDCLQDTAQVSRYHQTIAPYGTIYGMDVDATNKFIVTVGQDKKLTIYVINNGKYFQAHKCEDSGELIKVKLDPSGLYIAASSSDKTIRVHDFFSGECIAKVSGM